ncbi:nicotinic receptor-associated protein 4-like [Pollicipes pollicipes]|uniref:nicotinic receptor-associated protein 4-like n=1 Tax=Pollicipes pollicipes TaxID=41117 RepID=UPI001884C795|nr:nicotinic receptor-associated protein 4-like [Pollicipes pollicipes]
MGSNRLCVPTAGAYWLEPRGCHTFAEARVLTFQPQSDTLLFTPTYHQITAGEDCLPDAVAFQARRGAFITIGPLHPERQYQVTAEKEGYVISHTERHGHFRARKLAELRVRVTDEQGGPLGGVLVSVSGGKDYRRNSLTDEDGRQAFLSLSPGQYFIRPMMKEYEFTPPSKW